MQEVNDFSNSEGIISINANSISETPKANPKLSKIRRSSLYMEKETSVAEVIA